MYCDCYEVVELIFGVNLRFINILFKMPNAEKQFLIELVDLYKSFPCLWKVKSKEYSDRNAKSKAYEVMVEKMKEVDANATRDTIVKKFNNLRTSYRKELKKVVRSKESGAWEDDVYVPNLWYFDLLNFLRDQEVKETSVDESQAKNPENLCHRVKSEPRFESIFLPDVDTPSNSSTVSSSSNRQRHNHINKRKGDKRNKILEIIGKRPKSIQPDINTLIGNTWSAKLKDLPSEQQIHAEKLINDVFYYAALGNLNHRCTVNVVPSQKSPHMFEP